MAMLSLKEILFPPDIVLRVKYQPYVVRRYVATIAANANNVKYGSNFKSMA
jgi:hypothetical protein